MWRGYRDQSATNYSDRPFILIWEMTHACQLACRHCRAQAIPRKGPGELSTEEGRALLDAVAEMEVPVVVLSGGDPLKRDDIYELIRFGTEAGLRMSTIPAASSSLTRDHVARLRDAGVAQMALSLDAPSAATHDSFRGVPGSFWSTLEAAGWARFLGVPLQINSVLCRHTWLYFDELATLIKELQPVVWEIFFLVPVGRATDLGSLTATEYEEAFGKIRAVARHARFIVKVAEAPHYHRYCLERSGGARPGRRKHGSPLGCGRIAVVPGAVARAPAPVNAGKGFCFVSHRGEVFPSDLLPLSAGNLRSRPLAQIYRDSPLFQRLRDPDQLKGKCGVCPYRAVCGGSRSRAFALSGDPFAPEPNCVYEP